jgi:hypothetical protein
MCNSLCMADLYSLHLTSQAKSNQEQQQQEISASMSALVTSQHACLAALSQHMGWVHQLAGISLQARSNDTIAQAARARCWCSWLGHQPS